MGLENINVKVDNLVRVPINEYFQTNIQNVFPIGDDVESPIFAHKAEKEGVALAEYLSGHEIHFDHNAISSVIYTHTEVASVGKTEQQLKDAGVEYKVGLFPLTANSIARPNLDAYEGFFKILADKKTDRILCEHIIGPNAGDLIHELVIAVEYGVSSEDIARASHAHPSVLEAIKKAALAAYFKPIYS